MNRLEKELTTHAKLLGNTIAIVFGWVVLVAMLVGLVLMSNLLFDWFFG